MNLVRTLSWLSALVFLSACQAPGDYEFASSLQPAAFLEDGGSSRALFRRYDVWPWVKILGIDRKIVVESSRTSSAEAMGIVREDDVLIPISPGPHFVLVQVTNSYGGDRKGVLFLQAESGIHYQAVGSYDDEEMYYNVWFEEAGTGQVVTEPIRVDLID